MAPVDSGPIINDKDAGAWTTHPLGWRKAFYLAVKTRLIFLTGWNGNFWVQPTMPVDRLSKVLVCDVESDVTYDYWKKVMR